MYLGIGWNKGKDISRIKVKLGGRLVLELGLKQDKG